MSAENHPRPHLPVRLPDVTFSPDTASQVKPVAARSPFGVMLTLSGFAIIAALLGMSTLWSLIAPLESAVIAPGVVTVDSNVKTVQHLEGGIIEDILVREGDEVEAGDVLIKLQNTLPVSTLNEVRAQYYEALATQARLIAERDGRPALALPEELRANLASPAAREAFTGQQVILENRRKLLDQRLTIFEGTIEGLAIEIGGLEGQIRASERRLALVDLELDAVLTLLRQGLSDKPRALALERQKAEIEGAISSFRASIGVTQQHIQEAKLKMAELESARVSEVVQTLDEVRTRAYELAQKLAAAQDVFDRTEIRAPIHGVVVGVQVHTRGGVIAAGQPLLDIVPSNDKLVIQASIDPLDIDQVKPGLPATARLWALNRRTQAAIEGRLETVSADRLVDPNTGAAYYMARVELSPNSAELTSVTLQPGMSADVMIRTGARTPWEYVFAPIARSLSRALREE